MSKANGSNGHAARPSLGAVLEAIIAAPSPATAGKLVRLGCALPPVGAKAEEKAEPPAGAKAREKHHHGCILYHLPPHLANRVRSYAAGIPDEDLAPGKPPAKAREADPHVTILYGLTGEDSSPVHSLLHPERPVTVTLGTATVFSTTDTGEDYEVLIVPVEGEDLKRLHGTLASELPVEKTHGVYRPHVTIAYLRPGAGARWVGWGGLEGETAEIDRVSFCDRKGCETVLRLKGEAKKATLSSLREGGLSEGEESAATTASLDERIMLSLIRLGWVSAGKSRTGMPKWKDETGRVRYQREKPGGRGDRSHETSYTHGKMGPNRKAKVLQLVQKVHAETDRLSHPLARHGGRLVQRRGAKGAAPVKTVWGSHLTSDDHQAMARVHKQAARILHLGGHEEKARAHLAMSQRHLKAGKHKQANTSGEPVAQVENTEQATQSPTPPAPPPTPQPKTPSHPVDHNGVREGGPDYSTSTTGKKMDWLAGAIEGADRAMKRGGNPHLFIIGTSGSGKTTATHHIAEQRAKLGHDVHVVDLQAHEVDGKWPSASQVTDSLEDASEHFESLEKELDRRQKQGGTDHKPTTIVLSDVVDLMKQADRDTRRRFMRIINEGRKYGMAVILDAQTDNVGALNLAGESQALSQVPRLKLNPPTGEGGQRTVEIRGETFPAPNLPLVQEQADPSRRSRQSRREEIPEQFNHPERVKAEKNTRAFRVLRHRGRFVATDHDGDVIGVHSDRKKAQAHVEKVRNSKEQEWARHEFAQNRKRRRRRDHARLSTLRELLGLGTRQTRLSTLIRLGWRQETEGYRGKSKKWVGTDEHAGQVRYQATMPGGRGGKNAAAAAGQKKPAPAAVPEGRAESGTSRPVPAGEGRAESGASGGRRPAKRAKKVQGVKPAKPPKPTVESVVAHAKELLANPSAMDHAGMLKFLDGMLQLKLADMKKVREMIGGASGGRSKADVAGKVAGAIAAPQAQPQPQQAQSVAPAPQLQQTPVSQAPQPAGDIASGVSSKPASPAAKPAPAPSASPAHHASALQSAMRAHPNASANSIPIADLIDTLAQQGLSREQTHAAIQQLRREGVLGTQAIEGRHGATQREQDAAIVDPGGQAQGYVGFKEQTAPTPVIPAPTPSASPAPAKSEAKTQPKPAQTAAADMRLSSADVASVYDQAGTINVSEGRLREALEAVHVMKPAQLQEVAAATGTPTKGVTNERLRQMIKEKLHGRHGAATRANMIHRSEEERQFHDARRGTPEDLARIEELVKPPPSTVKPKTPSTPSAPKPPKPVKPKPVLDAPSQSVRDAYDRAAGLSDAEMVQAKQATLALSKTQASAVLEHAGFVPVGDPRQMLAGLIDKRRGATLRAGMVDRPEQAQQKSAREGNQV